MSDGPFTLFPERDKKIRESESRAEAMANISNNMKSILSNGREKYFDTSTFFPSEHYEERVMAHVSVDLWSEFVNEWKESVNNLLDKYTRIPHVQKPGDGEPRIW